MKNTFRLPVAAIFFCLCFIFWLPTEVDADLSSPSKATQAKSQPSNQPLLIEACLVEADSQILNLSAEAIRKAAKGDTSELFLVEIGTEDVSPTGLDARLRECEDKDLIRILAYPKFVTRLNESVMIQSGLQVPVPTVQNEQVAVRYINATLYLEIKPSLDADGIISLDIHLQRRFPMQDPVKGPKAAVPIHMTETRNLLIVRDGGTAVIGGIYHLSASASKIQRGAELVLLVTPKLIKI